ncbi:MKI67 FHA domain-interacting nucleolar phosphoprotein-like protein [Dinothrombium tinctorium]|uniref:MKI67 FHA domain-interacting nucleolar phosphoprotein-like protein n=1 Tax=Dinothrombium tinctorium TaxID=1965070 RepID=A0A3S4R4S5_9ACAR|nr:MKI67 FHA domain-interacting nucleolar phosphoprotein-like protein [Dinothrombium tinctorium]
MRPTAGRKGEKTMNCGVLFVRGFPHGFYEQQMLDYFSQFGKVTRVRLLRSRKTNKSKRVAFIEFLNEEVAKIAADSMNNYLMFDCILKCKFVPKDKLPPKLFHRWNLKRTPSVVRHKRKANASTKPENEYRSRIKKLKSIYKARELMRSFGIDYECTVINNDFKGDTSPKNVLIIDSSDEEFDFKTPPHTRKIAKLKGERALKIVQLKPQLDIPKLNLSKVNFKLSLPKFNLLTAAIRCSPRSV